MRCIRKFKKTKKKIVRLGLHTSSVFRCVVNVLLKREKYSLKATDIQARRLFRNALACWTVYVFSRQSMHVIPLSSYLAGFALVFLKKVPFPVFKTIFDVVVSVRHYEINTIFSA